MKILPATLIMLTALGLLVLVGDNFPLAPPGGNWNPTKSRFSAGLGMTVIWAVFTALLLVIMMYAFPKWPMSPLFLWWGALSFGTTLLYGINWNTWPFKGKMHQWLTMVIALVVVIIVASLVWSFLTNAEATPFAGSPFNHKGPFQADWLTGFTVWFIAWFFIFSPVFTTQGWPFTKLGHPGAAIGQTIVAFILACVCWNGSSRRGYKSHIFLRRHSFLYDILGTRVRLAFPVLGGYKTYRCQQGNCSFHSTVRHCCYLDCHL